MRVEIEDVQRARRVVHPETALGHVRKLEQHAAIIGQRRALHQAALTLGVVIGDLDPEFVLAGRGGDRQRLHRLAVRPLGRAHGATSQQQGAREGRQNSTTIDHTHPPLHEGGYLTRPF